MAGWRAARIAAVLLGVAAAGGCESMQDAYRSLGTSWDGDVGLSYRPEPPVPSKEALGQLAPTGKLRVALQLSNEVLVEPREGGQLAGVAVDFGRRIAGVLGVPFEAVTYPSGGRLLDAAQRNEWDIAFLAIETTRTSSVAFTRPYMRLEGAVLVPPNSNLHSFQDLDSQGVRIAVASRSAPDTMLSTTLARASVVRIDGGIESAVDTLANGKADAVVENRHVMNRAAQQLAGARELPGRLIVILHGIAVPKDRLEATAYLSQLIEYAINRDWIAAVIRDNQVQGALPSTPTY